MKQIFFSRIVKKKFIPTLYKSLWTLILSASSRILKSSFSEKEKEAESISPIKEALDNELALKVPREVGFGIEFYRFLSTIKLKPEVLENVYNRCSQYLLVSCTELVNRMPSNFSILKVAAKLSSNNILCCARKPSFDDLPTSVISESMDLTVLENQLRKIGLKDWSEYFSKEVLSDSTKF